MQNNWDKKEWQGRRKDQLDSTNVIVYATIVIISLTIFFKVLIKIGSYFLSNN